jgi:hypothetical protein
MQTYPPDFTRQEIQIWEAVRPHTMTSPERIVALMRATEYILRHNIPGDIVECGVWRGGSMMAVARTLIKALDTSRHLHLFDTYEGMTPPTEADFVVADGTAAADLLATEDPQQSFVWAIAGLALVKHNLESTGYPASRLHYIKGAVETTIPAQAPDAIALLRLDTDWYESTRHELIHLFPRLVPGGVLIIDDYGHWAGARKAVDEYLEEHQLPLLLCRTDYTGRIAIKPGKISENLHQSQRA